MPSCDVKLCPRPPSRVRPILRAGHFKLNFPIENSNFSQFFVSGIHFHTFSHNFAEKNFRFIGTLRLRKETLSFDLRCILNYIVCFT